MCKLVVVSALQECPNNDVAVVKEIVKATTNCSSVFVRKFLSSCTMFSLPERGSIAAVDTLVITTLKMERHRIAAIGRVHRRANASLEGRSTDVGMGIELQW